MTLQQKAINKLARIEHKIVLWTEYGRHIPLTCKNHPEKTWSTKNIDYIGARTLFYNLHNEVGQGQECECSLEDLKPIQPLWVDIGGLFLAWSTARMNRIRRNRQKREKLAQLGYTSGLYWVKDYREETGCSLREAADKAHELGLLG